MNYELLSLTEQGRNPYLKYSLVLFVIGQKEITLPKLIIGGQKIPAHYVTRKEKRSVEDHHYM